MNPRAEIYLVSGFTDMRKSINGLVAIVVDDLQLNPLSEAWFVFCNRNRDKLKILFWQHNGFWLYYRRLETGKFQWPKGNCCSISLTQHQLNWLLSGLSPMQNSSHKQIIGKNYF